MNIIYLCFKTFFFVAILPFLCTVLHAQNVRLDWVASIGSGNYNQGKAITTDPRGNVYTTGSFTGLADFDPGSGATFLTTSGNQDVFVSKLDADGNFLWAKNMDGNDDVTGLCIATDDRGNVYTAGVFYGTADFNPGSGSASSTAKGDQDIFITKLDTAGNFVWAKSIGGYGTDFPYAMTTDVFGNVYLTGMFQDTVDFNPGPNVSNLASNGKGDIFVLKLDTAGDFIWARGIGGKAADQGLSIAADISGNVYTTGAFQDVVDFDPSANPVNLTSKGNDDIFILKLNAAGNFVWARQFGDQGFERGCSVTTDTKGAVYATGPFQNTVDFDPGLNTANITSNGSNDVFILKLDSSGKYLWARNIGGKGSDYGYGIATDIAGGVYTTGYFVDTADFDPAAAFFNLFSNGVQDIFISKLDAAGNFVWAKSMGSDKLDVGYAVAVDRTGSIYTTGYFQGMVDFDPDTGIVNRISNGGADIFIHKMSCNDTSSSYFKVTTTYCEGYEWNGKTYTKSGLYTQAFPNAIGCDSVATLDLTISNDLDVHININAFRLGTTLPYKYYQWFLNGNVIPGATNSIYIIKENGDYSVAVENETGCKDTSAPYRVTNFTGMNAIGATQIKIYPNPAQNMVYIASPVKVNILLTSIEGKLIKRVENTNQIAVSNLEAGIYFLQVTDENNNLIGIRKLVLH